MEKDDVDWGSSRLLKLLVRKYAKGRPVCNCGLGWYYPVGVGIDRDGKKRTDIMACPYGCETNQFITAQCIARDVCAELGIKDEEGE